MVVELRNRHKKFPFLLKVASFMRFPSTTAIDIISEILKVYAGPDDSNSWENFSFCPCLEKWVIAFAFYVFLLIILQIERLQILFEMFWTISNNTINLIKNTLASAQTFSFTPVNLKTVKCLCFIRNLHYVIKEP